jgi:outer membrane protein assembly factor BamD
LPFHWRSALALAVLAALLAGCAASVMPQLRGNADRLGVARNLYAKGEYALVVEALSGWVTTGTGSADIDQGVHLLGLAYLRQKDWANAQAQFERIARDYPESDSARAAAYHLGEAFLGQSRGPDFDQEFTLRALTQWQRFVQDDDSDAYAALADARIAECRTRLAQKLWRTGDLYVKTNYYEPALIYFRSVISEYGDTPVLGDALLGLAVADAKLGRKDTALVVLKDLATRFEGQPLGERAAKTLARVERWPAEGDTKHQRHRMVEPALPTPQPTAPSSTTPFGQ